MYNILNVTSTQIGPRRKNDLEPTMRLNLCNDGWTSNHKQNEAVRVMVTVYRGAGKIYRKIDVTF